MAPAAVGVGPRSTIGAWEQTAFGADAQGKPRTRYEALFDLRHEFDEIRQGFVFEIRSRGDMDLLQDALGREENLNLEARDLDTLMTFCTDTWGALNQHTLVEGPCFNFAERAWPILVEFFVFVLHLRRHGVWIGSGNKFHIKTSVRFLTEVEKTDEVSLL